MTPNDITPLSQMGPQTTPSDLSNDQIQPNDVTPTPAQAPNASMPQWSSPQTAQPANPVTAQQPLAFRKSMFDRVLESMAGGPTKVTNPQTGVTTELPMTKKSLTSHILAGAITGIISGAQASAGAPSGPAGTNTPANMAALGAGFNATGQKLQDIRNQPQTQLDQAMIRRAAAIKNTTDELRNQLMSDKLHEEDWSSKEDYYSKTQDTWQPVVDNIEQADKDRAPNTPSLFVARALSSDEAMAKVKGAVGQMSPVQDGWTTETHSDGRTYHLPTFALVSNGTVPVSKDTLLALSPFNKGVADALNSKIGDTVELPATMLIGLEKQAGLAHGIYEFINQIQNGLDVPADQQLSQSAFNDQFRNNPALQRQAAQLGTTLSNLSTQSTAHALAQLQASGKAGEIFKLIGKSPDEISDFVDDKQNEEKKAAADAVADAKKKDADRPADSARIQNAPALINSSTSYLTPAQRTNYISKLHAGMSNAELDKVQKEASDENDRGFTHSMEQQRVSQEKAAKGDAAIAKGQKPVVGVDANGNQVLVPASDVPKYGLSQVREVGQAENEKVTNARSLLTVFNNNDPDDLGIMQLANKLDKEGKLGPAASRFQDWLNKSGSVPTSLAGFDAGDPDVQRLFTKLGLSTTGLMQVHVGARGSAQMLEHFEDLAKAKGMSPQAFKAAIDTENSYVKMKAMLPNSGKTATQTHTTTPQTVPVGGRPILKNGQTVGYIGTDGKRVNF